MEYKSENRKCQNCKIGFIIESEDFLLYEKIKVPPPTFCPDCRMIRRFIWRNERYLFRRKSALDNEEIFSAFPPEAKISTYPNAYWFSDECNPLAVGFEYNFNRNFFEQLKHLFSIAPVPTRAAVNLINSDYCNEASELKNCYLCFNSDYCENSIYLRKVNKINESIDLYDCYESELCYESVNVNKSYKTIFSLDCENCVDVWFSKNCIGCTNCFGCTNLINKSNCYFNQELSKEEYQEKVSKFDSGSYIQIYKMFENTHKSWLTFPNKYFHGFRNIDSTGEKIFDTKNVKYSYSIRSCENLKFSQDLQNKAYDSYDFTVQVDGSNNCYEYLVGGLGCYNIKFCFSCWVNVRDLEYCIFCTSSSDCFGCVGLQKKQYCIFNKQYTKEEYYTQREKIINHMNTNTYINKHGHVYRYGEFFPPDLSPIGYNQSLAQDFFPLKKEDIIEKGFILGNLNFKEYDKTISAENLPDNINEINNNFLKEIIECKDCSRAYKIMPEELQFYQKIKLPLPRLCHDCRFNDRFKLVNPPKFWHRSCMKEGCTNTFETSYSPDREEIVYCEKCYQQEVY